MNGLGHSLSEYTHTPKIKRLSSTDPALEHIKRAHLQIMPWKAADEDKLPGVNISQFGCDIIEGMTPNSSYRGISLCSSRANEGCGLLVLWAEQSVCAKENHSSTTSDVSCTWLCRCKAQGWMNPDTTQDKDDCVRKNDSNDQD